MHASLTARAVGLQLGIVAFPASGAAASALHATAQAAIAALHVLAAWSSRGSARSASTVMDGLSGPPALGGRQRSKAPPAWEVLVVSARHLLRFLWRQVQALLSHGTGRGLACLALLCWSTTYPSVSTFLFVAWVLREALRHNALSAYSHPSTSLVAVLVYCGALTVVQYLAALYAMWVQPSLFDPEMVCNAQSSQCFQTAGFASAAVQGLYGVIARAFGVSAAPTPGIQLALQVSMLVVVSAHVRAASIESTAETKRRGFGTSSDALVEAPLLGDLDQLGFTGRASPSPPPPPPIDSLTTVLSSESAPVSQDGDVLGTSWCSRNNISWFMEHTETIVSGLSVWVVLIVLYVLSLSHVDLVHTGYALFFVVFLVFDHLRRDYWRLLLWWTCACIALLFSFDFVTWALGRLTYSNIPDWVVGPGITTPSVDLWSTSYTNNLVILCFTVLQAPHYDPERAAERKRRVDRLFTALPWLKRGMDAGLFWQARLGIWVCYVVFIAASLVPSDVLGTLPSKCSGHAGSVNVMSLATLVLTACVLIHHCRLGFAAAAQDAASAVSLARLLRVMALMQGVFLVARYLFQFNFFADLVAQVACPIQSVLTIDELGLQQYNSALYRALLNTVITFVLAVFQERAIASVSHDVMRSDAGPSISVGIPSGGCAKSSDDGALLNDAAQNMPRQPSHTSHPHHRPGSAEASWVSIAALIALTLIVASGLAVGVSFGSTIAVAACTIVIAAVAIDVGIHGHEHLLVRWRDALLRFNVNATSIARHVAFLHSGALTLLTAFAAAISSVSAMSACYALFAIFFACVPGCSVGSLSRFCSRQVDLASSGEDKSPARVNASSTTVAQPHRSVNSQAPPVESGIPTHLDQASEDFSYHNLPAEVSFSPSRLRSPVTAGSDAARGAIEGDGRIDPHRSAVFPYAWIPALALSLAGIITQYGYQLSVFSPCDDRHRYSVDDARWAGFFRADLPFPASCGVPTAVTYEALWRLCAPHLCVLAAALLQRWSKDFKDHVLKEEVRTLELSHAFDRNFVLVESRVVANVYAGRAARRRSPSRTQRCTCYRRGNSIV